MPGPDANDLARDNPDAIRAFWLLSIFFFFAVAAAYVSTTSWVHPIPRDGTTMVIGRDFLNFWMYGRSAVTPNPSIFYDPGIYNQELGKLLGPGYLGQHWSYPPSIMLLAAPFGQLSYLTALLAWTVLSAVIFLWAARRRLTDPRLLLALLFSPAAVLAVISGQNSLITVAMMMIAFGCMDRRPVGAGILIGLLTVKPQIGILFPVMLAASGRWRVFMVAAATAAAIAGLTAAVFGPQVWLDFVTVSLPVQNYVLSDPRKIATPFYPTIFMNLRGIDASYAVAMAVQVCVSVAAAGAVAWAYRYRKNADPQLLMALFFACMICVTPYLLSYDTLAMTFAALMLLATGKLDTLGRRLAQLVFWLPIIQLGLGTWYIPGPALIAPAFAIYLVMRLNKSRDREISIPARTA
jgi:Glycosyltransferase family 87